MVDRLLIVEDDELQAENIRTYLERRNWMTYACGSAEDALLDVREIKPTVIVVDQTLPGMSGTTLAQQLAAIVPGVPVIMVTGDESARTAVDAMKAGVVDYLTKPVSLTDLHERIGRFAGQGARVEPVANGGKSPRPAAKDTPRQGLDLILGQSPAIKAVKDILVQLTSAEARMADDQLPAVLVRGETGTGKELVAQALHTSGSRRNGPFIEINCAAIPSHLLEAELFGHERGAFTDAKDRKCGLVEAADGGTLFLDEIGEIAPAVQAKLLKLLEEKTIRRLGSTLEKRVNIRIVSATNRDLEQMVRDGLFRSDLYFRLRIIGISVPPLRERGEDILLLARHFLALHGRRYGKPTLYFDTDTERVLRTYSWPGNVREMRNMLEQTVLLAADDRIRPEQLTICNQLGIAASPPSHASWPGPATVSAPAVMRRNSQLADQDRDLLVRALDRTDWNVTKSARLLGLSRDMLRYRMEKMGLYRPEA